MPETVFDRSHVNPALVAASLGGSTLGSYWLDGLDVPTWPVFAGSERFDLVVVGGGYTGLWTALLAKHRDPSARVAVLEGRTVGWAASGRNGGFCEASLTHGEANGEKRWPRELDQLNRLGLENLDEIEATVAAGGWDVDFERTGTLSVAVEPYQVAGLRDAADGDTELFFDEAAVRAEVDSPTYLAGLWSTRTTAVLDPGKLVAALAVACAEAGVEIFERSAVRGLDTRSTAGAVVVETKQGTAAAARVALATNAFPSLLGRYRLHTVPVYDYVLMTEPLTDAQIASIGWQNRQGLSDLANQFHYYRLTADNRILWGGYDAVYHYGGHIRPEYDDRPQSFATLAAHFFATFPQLEGVRFSHRWGGVIDTSTRFNAFFGRASRGRISYAAGFTGLGVAATRFAANVMLDHLGGLDTERTALQMVRSVPPPFPPEPAAYLGVQATRWSMDRADHNEGKRNLLLKTLDAAGLGFDS
ncbi:glycine/D-amino acid oxidase-like deaminating enzyme [Conyzicola lurida]|uniref:Glycine/D-amino acid oxidase-like deaminating enzyme n=1 Tax=Conyzicola lurida TaxID=1172621 RepID=A0A841APS3_9MICO|nr:FAD-binding oxidoreductase [Conyzicola lurida]MBB5843593.1 glycine/D-amino acid oxidase-like deaminating enzyme [Conyzicola lurida]